MRFFCSDGVELAPLLQDDFYDFNFQQYVFLDTPITVLPGDDLGLTCNYDTTGRTEGGYHLQY